MEYTTGVEEIKNNVPLEEEEYAYGFIIEVLTGGLYPTKLHVLREYIQNSYDAICDYIKNNGTLQDPQISIYYDNSSIFIYDNGSGMDREKISDYKKIGYSKKKIGSSAGFRGIGKLAGLSVAEKLIVTSKPVGGNERYKVIFDAEAMLSEIMKLKVNGENVSLKELIIKYTDIQTEIEDDQNSHYTLVELHNVKNDSKILFEENKVREYISLNCPVRFGVEFSYSKEIEENLRDNVIDYFCVPIFLGENEVFKPYTDNAKSPRFIEVWEDEESDEPTGLLAYCWFCENKDSSQFEDKTYSGLLYKCKNFTVGDKHLTRKTLWYSTPERAFRFFGEIYICSNDMIPSSERSDFEHNDMRDLFYTKCKVISKTLNNIAGKSSDINSAIEKTDKSEEIVYEVKREIQNHEIPEELRRDKMLTIFNAINIVEQKSKKLPSEEYKKKAEKIIEEGKQIIKMLDNNSSNISNSPDLTKTLPTNSNQEVKAEISSGDAPLVYNIKEILKFGDEASNVYDTIITCLKDEFVNDKFLLEKLIKKIHKYLEDSFTRG